MKRRSVFLTGALPLRPRLPNPFSSGGGAVHRSKNGILTPIVAVLISAMVSGSLHAQAAAAICKDGTTSVATGRGACSGHGGVDRKAVAHQKKVVKRETRAAKAVTRTTAGKQVTTICMDGTTSNSTGRGTCAGHGGARAAEATSATTGA